MTRALLTRDDLAKLRAVATAAHDETGWKRGPMGIYVFREDNGGMVAEAGDMDQAARDAGAVAEPRGHGAGRLDDYANHVAAFDPPTVLALLDELLAARPSCCNSLQAGSHRVDCEKHGVEAQRRNVVG